MFLAEHYEEYKRCMQTQLQTLQLEVKLDLRRQSNTYKTIFKLGPMNDSSISALGRSPEEGNGNPLQCSCLENSMDRGPWWVTAQRLQRVGHDWAWKIIKLSMSKMVKRRRQWHPTPVLLPGKSHRRRSLVGCSPWGR